MAYALIHVVEATVSYLGQYYTSYYDQTTLGDYLGGFELVTFLVYIVWIAGFSLAGNYLSLVMWLNIEANEDDTSHVNKLTSIQGYKYLTVGILISLGAWISALGIGEQAGKLLSIFDAYSTSQDTTGSALFIDFNLHTIESIFNLFVLTTIAAGGYIVGIFIMGEELNFSEGVASLSNQVSTATTNAEKVVKK